jgi:hypothetical protein
MKSLVKFQSLVPFSQTQALQHNLPSGILNSNYKAVANQNFNSLKKPSLFSIKQRLKSKQYNTSYAVAGTLKVALFVVGLLIAFN